MRFPRRMQLALGFIALGIFSQGRGASVADAAAEPATVLPAFVVNETPEKIKWRYIGSPRFEILANGSDQRAIDLAAKVRADLQILELLIPAQVRLKSNLPLMIILSDIPNQKVSYYWSKYADKDALIVATGVGALASGSAFRSSISRGAVPSFVHDWLSKAAPRPADWMLSLTLQVANLSIEGAAVRPRGFESPRKENATPSALMPLEKAMEILSEYRGLQSEERMSAAVTGRLFVQWAVFAENGKYRAGFWDYYLRTGQTPRVTEALFRECFGLSYAAAMESLQAFRKADIKSFTIDYKKSLSPVDDPSPIRDATPAEIGRMTGEWSRAAASEPAFFRITGSRDKNRLLSSAGGAFERALKETTPSDPKLDAAAGIYFAGLGRDAEALRLLESAAKGSVVRPRAYLELARIRLAATRASGGAPAKLSAAQFAGVLEPLRQSYTQSVQQEQYYELLVSLWENAAEKPKRSDLASLVSGASLFPRNTDFALRAARLHATHGFIAEAKALGEGALVFASSESTRSALKAFIDVLAVTPAQPTPANGAPPKI